MDPEKQTEELPESLNEKFRQLEQALWRKETREAIFGGVLIFLGTWIVAFASDRLWDSPVRLRSTFLIAMLLGMLACGVVWMRHWRWDRREAKSFSRMIQRLNRRLGDRLLGAVELAEGESHTERMSPALRRAAIDQVAGSVSDFDFTSVVDNRRTNRLITITILTALATIAGIMLAPKAAINSLSRLAAPFLEIPRYTFVSLEDLPREMIVRHGEEFTVKGRVKYNGFWKPSTARVRFEQQNEQEISVSDLSLIADVSGQNQDGILHLTLGDTEANIMIMPVHPPALGKLHAQVEYPKYLDRNAEQRDFSGPTLTVIEGSKLSLHAEANRELSGVKFAVDGGEPLDLPIAGTSFETPVYEPNGEIRGSIHIEDQLGLTNAAPRQFLVRTRPDDAPMVQLRDLPSEISILESDVLPLKLLAQDDYGIKRAGVGWKIENVHATNQPAVREFTTLLTNTSTLEFTNTYVFSPTILGVPPETVVELRAAAVDHFPDRGPAFSIKHRIHIVGNIRHAKTVRDQLEALFSQLEEITREEESITQKTAELKNRTKTDEEAKLAERELDGQAVKQEQNNQHLNEIAKGGQRILEEAMRNPTINQKTLKDWTQNISSMEDLAKKEMAKAAQSMRKAQQQSGAGQKQRQQQQKNLAEAQDSQQEALQKLQKLQQRMNSGLDNLEALTIAQRLKRLAGDEEGLVSQLRSVITETIGLKSYQLQDRHRMMNARLSGEQEELSRDAENIQKEIGRFFDRTRKENYGQVNAEMKETKVSTELADISGLIKENIAMETMQNLQTWRNQLKTWADLLKPPSEEGSSSAGKGKGNAQQQQKMIKMLIAFLRLRLNEVNLHHRTRLLDDSQGTTANHERASSRLADDQRDIRERFSQLQWNNDEDAFRELMAFAQGTMSDAEYALLEPNTGAPTQNAQISTIEHLSDLINLINEQAKRQNRNSQKSQSQQERQAMQQMQMLMQIARQQMRSAFSRIPGMKPGTNPANGGGRGQAGQIGGDAVGAGDAERGTDRASATGTQIPAEFREAMERYFKAVEQQQKDQTR